MNRKNFLYAGLALITCFIARAKTKATSAVNNKTVGGGCDGCNLMYEGTPSALKSTAYLPGWNSPGQKLIVEGTIYHADRKTPAKGVILYVYHTDTKGYYAPAAGQVHGVRHGQIRGWIKTGADGHYKFYTNMPAPYPQKTMPAHIHPTIKEPGLNEYYIDEFQFTGDPLLTAQIIARAENRGGSGIVKLRTVAPDTIVCKRDIMLGLNIPNHPFKTTGNA